jgi:hypothetical protein
VLESSRLKYSKNNFINISFLKTSDGGSYTCIVQNGIGRPKSITINIVVEKDVEVFIQPHKDAHKEGGTLKLRCDAEGHPPPEIKWFHERRPLEASDRIHITEGELEMMHLKVSSTIRRTVLEKTLLIDSNTKFSLRVANPLGGRKTGRGLTTRRAHHYDPLTAS